MHSCVLDRVRCGWTGTPTGKGPGILLHEFSGLLPSAIRTEDCSGVISVLAGNICVGLAGVLVESVEVGSLLHLSHLSTANERLK